MTGSADIQYEAFQAQLRQSPMRVVSVLTYGEVQIPYRHHRPAQVVIEDSRGVKWQLDLEGIDPNSWTWTRVAPNGERDKASLELVYRGPHRPTLPRAW